MKNTLSNILVFAVGAAIGSAVTAKLVKRKYEQIADEEIESMREYFTGKEKQGVKMEPVEEPDGSEYNDILRSYTSTLESEAENKNKEETRVNTIYIISPDEFGEDVDYETSSFTYYADGVLTDEMDEIIDNAEEIVGRDYASHFGDYEDDSVFIRNDERKCYYEILRDSRPYAGR